MKSFLANMFGAAQKTAQLGYDESDWVRENLIMAFSVENSEVAMYKSPALAAAAAGDAETEQLARTIQKQDQETADKVWAFLPVVAERSYHKVAESSLGVQRAG